MATKKSSASKRSKSASSKGSKRSSRGPKRSSKGSKRSSKIIKRRAAPVRRPVPMMYSPMMKSPSSDNNMSSAEILGIVVLLAVIFIVGILIYQNYNPDLEGSSSPSPSSPRPSSPTPTPEPSEGLKGWQIALIIAAVVGVVGVAYYFYRGRGMTSPEVLKGRLESSFSADRLNIINKQNLDDLQKLHKAVFGENAVVPSSEEEIRRKIASHYATKDSQNAEVNESDIHLKVE